MKIISRKEIRYYTDEAGRCFYLEWLSKLDLVTRVIITKRVDRLSEGNPGHARPVGNGVHELKIDCGPGYRVYFANDGHSLVLILAGGSKKRQSKDVNMAKSFWIDWNNSAE